MICGGNQNKGGGEKAEKEGARERGVRVSELIFYRGRYIVYYVA